MVPSFGESFTWYTGKREPVVTVTIGAGTYALSMADMIRCCQARINAERVLQGLAARSKETMSKSEAGESASLLVAHCQQVRRWKSPDQIKVDRHPGRYLRGH